MVKIQILSYILIVSYFTLILAPAERIGIFCSNRPVVCKIIKNLFWSYNMRFHNEDFHQGANFDEEFIIH